MSNIDKGGPAFPVPTDLANKLGCVSSESDAGMSIRDYFAAKALMGILAHKNALDWTYLATAEDSYRYADAMIKAREREL